jgi:hypothetical protein
MAKKKAELSIEDMMGFDLRPKTEEPAPEKKVKKKVKRPAQDLDAIEETPAPKKRGRPPLPKNTEQTPKGRDRDQPVTDVVVVKPERDPLEDDDDDMGLTVSRKRREVVTVDEDGSRISRLKSGSLNSILGDDAENIQQLLEVGDSDSAASVIQKRALQTCIDLVAEVENGIRESKGRYGVHSFNNLMMTIRELVTDMQQTRDRGAIGVTISESVLRPMMRDLAMLVMNETMTIMAAAKGSMSVDEFKDFRKEVDDSRARIGAAMQQAYTESRDRSRTLCSGHVPARICR